MDARPCWRTGNRWKDEKQRATVLPRSPVVFNFTVLRLSPPASLHHSLTRVQVCSVILQADFPRGLYALLDEDDSHDNVACLLTFEESRELALKVMAMYGPYGSVRMDNWCTVCNGYNTCVSRPCSKLNGRCLLCGLSTHTSATCPNRNGHPNPEERLNVPSGFCYHCLLPLFITQ